MQFCVFCDNMLFIRNIESNGVNKVELACKYCNNTESFEESGAKLISSSDFKSSRNPKLNKNLAFDLTLPRETDLEIACKNRDCSKPVDAPNDLIVFRQDNVNKIYLYHCTYCKHTFHTGTGEP